ETDRGAVFTEGTQRFVEYAETERKTFSAFPQHEETTIFPISARPVRRQDDRQQVAGAEPERRPHQGTDHTTQFPPSHLTLPYVAAVCVTPATAPCSSRAMRSRSSSFCCSRRLFLSSA